MRETTFGRLRRLVLPNPGDEHGSGDGQDDPGQRYRAVELQSRRETGIRVALWGAVVVGALGGVLGLVRSSTSEAAPADEDGGNGDDVPASVAGFAEVAVDEWLSATGEDAERLEALYLDVIAPVREDGDGFEVLRVRTVGGRLVEDDYWQVVVAADVTEPHSPADGSEDPDGASGDELDEAGDLPGDDLESARADADDREDPVGESGEGPDGDRWFVEVGVVGDSSGGLAAVRMPAVVEHPPEVADDRRTSGGSLLERPDESDPLVELAGDFLRAWLAGDGDPGRLIVAGGELAPVTPAPFADLEVVAISVDELGVDDVRLQVHAQATTPGGSEQVFAYELYAQRSVSRWEVYDFSGAPHLEAGAASGSLDGQGRPGGTGLDDGAADDAVTGIDEE